jgi:hypothetical protein
MAFLTILEFLAFCTSMVCLVTVYHRRTTMEKCPDMLRPLSNSQELLFHIRRQLLRNRILAATFYNLLQVPAQNSTLLDHGRNDTRMFLNRWPTFVPVSRASLKPPPQEVCIPEVKLGTRFSAKASTDEVEIDQELWQALDAANKVSRYDPFHCIPDPFSSLRTTTIYWPRFSL